MRNSAHRVRGYMRIPNSTSEKYVMGFRSVECAVGFEVSRRLRMIQEENKPREGEMIVAALTSNAAIRREKRCIFCCRN